HTLAHDLLAAPLGGALFAVAAAAPFLLDFASFVAAAALVVLMRGTFRTAPEGGRERTTLRAEIAEGIRWLAGHRLLRTLALAIALMNLTLTAATSILVLVARDRLGLGSVGYGLLFSAMAVGGVAGSLAGGRLIARVGASTTLRAGLVIE